MKKSLFLLPLVGGFMLSACTFNLFGKEIKLFEKESSSSNSGSGSGSTTPSGSGSTTPSGGGSTTPTGGGGGEKGTGLSTVTLYQLEDIVDKSGDPLEFTDKGCKVTVSLGANTQNSLADAVTASKYEFRIYKSFGLKVEADTEFTKIEVIYSTYKSGTSTYYFDFDASGATKEVDNSFDTSNHFGKATYTLSSAAKSFDFGNVAHQTRVKSFTFVA